MEPIRARDGRPNVVVVMIDTARAGHMDFYGGPGGLTPFLSELARESTCLTRAFSTSSWTAPSTASLFTGQYPNEHGVTEGFFVHKQRVREQGEDDPRTMALNRIRAGTVTLPVLFRRNGYSTFASASNPNICDAMGFASGFDRFHQKTDASAEVVFAQLRTWRDELEGSQPYFVYVHVSDPHEPYEKWEEFYVEPIQGGDEGDEMKARYWSELRYVDAQIRRMYEWLGADQNTIFVVVSDHGEEFFDHGETGHKPQLYNELTQVVMLLHAPGLGIEAQEIDVNVSLIDVLPTLAELAEIDLDGVDTTQPVSAAGRSLVPLLRRAPGAVSLREELAHRTLFAHRTDHDGGDWWAATNRNWKLIERPDGTRELYDHEGDLGERNDVIARHPERAEPLREALDGHKAFRPEAPPTRVEIDLDDELQESLKDLGYVE